VTCSGLLVDYGGVLTTSVTRSFRAWCAKLGLPPDLAGQTFVEAYEGPHGEGPVQQVETGRLTAEEFAVGLAAALSERAGVHVPSDGLLEGLFAEARLDERMLAAVAAARAAGIRTGLLSNSWGTPPTRGGYPRERFGELFDAVVLSGEVGLRKPDPAIFTLAADRLNLPPAACVFVDDLDTNVRAAEAIGMTGLHHRRAEDTLPRLAALLGLQPSVLGI
jgi:epoxide hydrolase-like predicted phosphatase